MSRIYTPREGDGKRFLAAIKCDRCGAEVKPNPQIASSGWEKGGISEPKGLVSTFLILRPDPVRTNLTREPVWITFSWWVYVS